MDPSIKKIKRRSKRVVDSTARETRKLTTKVALDVESIALVQIREMAAVIRTQVAESKARVDAELETYKKERMAQIDEEVKSLVAETAKKILGQVISLNDHAELTIKALEDAKRSGIL